MFNEKKRDQELDFVYFTLKCQDEKIRLLTEITKEQTDAIHQLTGIVEKLTAIVQELSERD